MPVGLWQHGIHPLDSRLAQRYCQSVVLSFISVDVITVDVNGHKADIGVKEEWFHSKSIYNVFDNLPSSERFVFS